MAKLTKEQAIKWDKMLSSGYRLDVRHYMVWWEKTASLKIKLAENKILEGSLSYREERQGYRYTGRQVPVLHLQMWNVDANGVGISHGLGAWINVGEIQDKKNWKYLCALSAEYPAEKVLALAKEHAAELSAATLLESLQAAG